MEVVKKTGDRVFRIQHLHLMALLMLIAGLSRLFVALWHAHTGRLPGDTSTYVQYARLLARCQVTCESPVTEISRADHGGILRVAGPFWNTSILPNGRTVFTYSPGYPLFLAGMFRAGGAWLLLHANFLLLAVLLLVLCVVVWDGLGRTTLAVLSGVTTALLLPRLQLSVFDQLSYPWREPLTFLCVIIACLSLTRFLHKPCRAWLWLMALFLGYACCVKEANIVYIPCFIIITLLSSAHKRLENRASATALAALFFLLGIAPLLLQNILTTGNVLTSLQSLRETGNYGAGGRVQGLSIGNLWTTVKLYARLYSEESWFAPPLVLLALWGLVAARRSSVGKLYFGLLLLHVGLYVQWPTADFRYMYFVNILYAFFLSYGCLTLVQAVVTRLWRAPLWGWSLGLLPAFVLTIWPIIIPASRWAEARPMRYSDAQRLAQDIEDYTTQGGVVLINRTLRDALCGHTDRPLIRLRELSRVREDGDIQKLIQDLLERGTALYFVDNTDSDPRHCRFVDWSGSDQQSLLWRHDLAPICRWSTRDMQISEHTPRPHLYLYAVRPWRQPRFQSICQVPRGGAAFLFTNPRSLGNDLVMELNGRSGSTERIAGYYVPVHKMGLTSNVLVTCGSATQQPVPTMPDMRFISWHEPIALAIGADAFPADDPYLPERPGDQPDTCWREMGSRFRLIAPVRNGPSFFSVVRLFLVPDAALSSIEVTGCGPCNVNYDGSVVFPVSIEGLGGDEAWEWAGVVSAVPSVGMRLAHAVVYTCYRTIQCQPPPQATNLCLTGVLVPDSAGPDPRFWYSTLNGESFMSGECNSDPFTQPIQIRIPVPKGTSQITLTLEGVGIVNPVIESQ